MPEFPSNQLRKNLGQAISQEEVAAAMTAA